MMTLSHCCNMGPNHIQVHCSFCCKLQAVLLLTLLALVRMLASPLALGM
jgi:hypothetical protein